MWNTWDYSLIKTNLHYHSGKGTANPTTGEVNTSSNCLDNGNLDTRRYEKAISDVGASDYEKTIVPEYEIYHKHFATYEWGKKFSGPFLDYGCGTGVVSQILRATGQEIVALDISREMVSIAKKHNVPTIVAEALHLPFKNKVFSTICISGVLHHIGNLNDAFNELDRCAKEAICVIEPSTNLNFLARFIRISFIIFSSLYSLLPHTIHTYVGSVYERDISLDQITRLFRKHSFNFQKIRFFTHIPLFKLRRFFPEKIRYYLIRSLISSKRGNIMEIIATRFKVWG